MATPKHRFFASPDCFSDGAVCLPEDEGRHAARVLRLSPGDVITVVDGAGGTHVVRLEDVSRKAVSGRVLRTEMEIGESTRRLSMGVALLKNRNRFETFIEKAVELGVNRIVPLQTRRTERQKFRRDRTESILISALKQSGRSRLPELVDVRTFEEEVLETPDGNSDVIRLLAHEAASDAGHLIDTSLGSGEVHIFVGPEGGFSNSEVATALEAGLRTVWMGPRRLRAESAAIVAAGVLRMRMDQDAQETGLGWTNL